MIRRQRPRQPRAAIMRRVQGDIALRALLRVRVQSAKFDPARAAPAFGPPVSPADGNRAVFYARPRQAPLPSWFQTSPEYPDEV